jgi:hypothetical protein
MSGLALKVSSGVDLGCAAAAASENASETRGCPYRELGAHGDFDLWDGPVSWSLPAPGMDEIKEHKQVPRGEQSMRSPG